MAYIGFRKIMVAELNSNATYGTPTACGRAMSMTVTPNMATGDLYGDDVNVEHVENFTDADIEIGATYIPTELYETMFGHTVADTVVTFNTDDSVPYCGVGAIAPKLEDGTEYWEAIFLPKVKFSEPEASFETKGDSITFNTPTISGKALADSSKNWKKTTKVASEAAALTWINSQFGVTQ